jgi:integrase
MTVRELLQEYGMSHEMSFRYLESMRRTVKKLETSGITEVGQLTAERINNFLAMLPLSATTRSNIRRELLTLWRFAHEEGLTDVQPCRIRKIRQASTPPTCWTREELQRLMECARQDNGRISNRLRNLKRCDVLPAWVGVGFETAVRFSDILHLKRENIRNGCVVLTARKTGKGLVRQLSPGTIKAVTRLLDRSPDDTVFLWCLPRRRAVKMWKEFLKEHGFAGSSKWLRRAAATQSELRERGSATQFLQHSQAHLATRHYIDQSQLTAPVGPAPLD